MNDEMLDKDDKYSPIRFSRNYFDEPTKVQPYWISKVSVKNMVGVGRPVGTAEIDFLGKPALTAPNGYGKTLLLKLVYAVMELANGYQPTMLQKMVFYGAHDYKLFDVVTVETVGGNVYSLTVDDWFSGSFVFDANGEQTVIDKGQLDSIVPTQYENVGCYLLPTGRLFSPQVTINELLDITGGKVDYEFLNKWYNLMMQGIDIEKTPDTAMKRYADMPYNTESTISLSHWIKERHFSHGEVELLMHLMAMTSGCGIVLIDAAETSLHLSVQVYYMNLLSFLYQHGVQVIFATHSPTMFDMNFANSNDLFELFDPKEP